MNKGPNRLARNPLLPGAGFDDRGTKEMPTTTTEKKWGDEQLELILAKVLLSGVISAAVVVLIGGVLYLIRHPGPLPDYREFHGESSPLRGIRGILKAVAAGQGRGLIQFGLVLLIATPVMRVALSLAGFVRERDNLYCVFTLIVLITLLLSLAGWHF
jgi:uncharacterized membrane protein